MTTKAQQLRNKRAQSTPQAARKPSQGVVASSGHNHTATPTNERLARGNWASPSKDTVGPYVDRSCDMIGRLMVQGIITPQQEQTARDFSQVYAAYKAEIGIAESKSCLAVSSGGFDSGDGDPDVYKRYYAMRDKIGRVRTAMLQDECFKMTDDRPNSILALRDGLDRLAG